MDDRRPVTRAALQRALVVNALTKPVNVAVPAGVVVAGIVIGTPWLLVVAAVIYAVLAAMTFLDEREAEQVGDRAYGRERLPQAAVDPARLAPEVRTQVEAAQRERELIARTIDESDLSFADVRAEVAALVRALEGAARRAQRLAQFLSSQDVAALDRRIAELRRTGDDATLGALDAQRAQLRALQTMSDAAHAEMEQVVAALRTVHGRLVGLAVTHEAEGEAELVGDVRDLRDRVETLTADFDAAPTPHT